MKDIDVIAEVVYLRSKGLLEEMQTFYQQNERWISPKQRHGLKAGMKDIRRLLRMYPRRYEGLPHRAIGGALDSLYNATYTVVGKCLPARKKS